MPGQFFTLQNDPPFLPGTMLLLTDGTVMCQESGTRRWWRLTPNALGIYWSGTWSRLADSPTSPRYFASAVLRDGRVFVAGGEYSAGILADLNTAAIYDPMADKWTSINGPIGWIALGDLSNCVLEDGRILVGSIVDNQCAIYDPDSNTWTEAGRKKNLSSNEETWTLLHDGTVLTVNCIDHPGSQRYLPETNKWVDAGSTIADLVEDESREIGPAILLPNRRCFCIGATGKTAYYTPPPFSIATGHWNEGPLLPVVDLPGLGQLPLGAKDAPACLLPNGRILIALGPVNGKAMDYLGPTYIYEFQPGSPAFGDPVLVVGDDPHNPNQPKPYHWVMLPIPSGEVLLANAKTRSVLLYKPDGPPIPEGKPAIMNGPFDRDRNFLQVRAGETFTISGALFNGLSQAASYGDDASMATNYPLVRIESPAGTVWYCRTFGHSSMGVNVLDGVSTNFTVPATVPPGYYSIRVVATGIPSDPVPVWVLE